MYISAGAMEQFDYAKSVGIGLIDVAINLTKICIEENPEELIFIGSAGSYGEKNIFDIVHSTNACSIESSFLQENSYSPITNIVSRETSDTMVNSLNYITTNKKLAAQYLNENIEIENMEFYSVMSVAKKFNIKARGVFVVTNFCDENAHRDFVTNHKKAMEILNKQILQERT